MTTIDYTGCIATYSGRIINPFDPDPEAIDIADIAHALSLQCRFTGHTKHMYTVAQHSFYASFLMEGGEEEYALWALLHDATEAYLADIARPVKAMWPEYKTYEVVLMEAVAERFGLEKDFPMPQPVAFADDWLLANEIRYLMPKHEIYDRWDFSEFTALPKDWFEYEAPTIVEGNFLQRFNELGGE